MSAPAKTAAAGPAKKGKLPLIIGLVVLLAGGGGGGYFWWSKQQAVKAAEAAAKSGGGKKAAQAADGDDEHASDGHDDADAESHEDGEAAGGEEAAGALVALNTFTVNLADPDAPRFLRTNVQLVIDATEEEAKHLEEEKVPVVRARAAVLELLTQQTSQVINTPEGKAELKKQIKKSTAKLLHHKVTDVLFSDFVIQF